MNKLPHDLRMGFRHLLRQAGYNSIVIAGLGISVAVMLFVLKWVRHETSYDRHVPEAGSVFRIQLNEEITVMPVAAGPRFLRDLPMVASMARVYKIGDYSPVAIRSGTNLFEEPRFVFADSTLFEVFGIDLVEGDSRSALVRPRTVVLTHETARRYFGEEPALGRVLLSDTGTSYEVTGVMAPIATPTHLPMDLVASFTTTVWAQRDWWSSANFETYVRTSPGTTDISLQMALNALMDRVRSETDLWDRMVPVVMPLPEIHLRFEGGRTRVFVLTSIGILLLVVASVNHMNLATARAASRAKSIGILQACGARRSDLIRQFYVETGILVAIAIALGLVLAEMSTPWLQAWVGVADLKAAVDPGSLLALFAGLTAVTGAYPVWALSRFSPADVMRSRHPSGAGGTVFRKWLVVFQIAVAVSVAFAAVIVHRQSQFMREAGLGFDPERIHVLAIGDPLLSRSWQALRDAIRTHPDVSDVAVMNSIPGYQRGAYGLLAEGWTDRPDMATVVAGVAADSSVIRTLRHGLLAGTSFTFVPEAYPDSGSYQYIVNERLLDILGWTPQDAIGRRLGLSDRRMGTVVGVVRNHHYRSLHEPIGPLAYFAEPDYNHMLIRLHTEDAGEALDHIREQWERMVPHRPFQTRTLQDALADLYTQETRLSAVFTAITILTVLISCLGLFGMASHAAEERTKEIGVRKVLGARVRDIVRMLNGEYTKLVLIGALISALPAIRVARWWLERFTYRVEADLWLFGLTVAAVLMVAMAAVMWQSLRAAYLDPAESLRDE